MTLPSHWSCIRACFMQTYLNCLCFPPQSTQWKSSGREMTKSSLHMSGRDPVFTSPVSAAKPSTPVSAPQHNTPKEVKTQLETLFGSSGKHLDGIALWPSVAPFSYLVCSITTAASFQHNSSHRHCPVKAEADASWPRPQERVPASVEGRGHRGADDRQQPRNIWRGNASLNTEQCPHSVCLSSYDICLGKRRFLKAVKSKKQQKVKFYLKNAFSFVLFKNMVSVPIWELLFSHFVELLSSTTVCLKLAIWPVNCVSHKAQMEHVHVVLCLLISFKQAIHAAGCVHCHLHST